MKNVRLKVSGIAIGKEKYSREFVAGVELPISKDKVDIAAVLKLVVEYIVAERGMAFMTSLCDVDVAGFTGNAQLFRFDRLASLGGVVTVVRTEKRGKQ